MASPRTPLNPRTPVKRVTISTISVGYGRATPKHMEWPVVRNAAILAHGLDMVIMGLRPRAHLRVRSGLTQTNLHAVLRKTVPRRNSAPISILECVARFYRLSATIPREDVN